MLGPCDTRPRLLATHPASCGARRFNSAVRVGKMVWQLSAGGIRVGGALHTGEPSVLITCQRRGWYEVAIADGVKLAVRSLLLRRVTVAAIALAPALTPLLIGA